jgi:hypothetical protein
MSQKLGLMVASAVIQERFAVHRRLVVWQEDA